MEGNGGLFATTIISTKLAKSSKSENSESKSMQLLTIKSITCKPKSEWYFLACVHGLKDVELHNIIAKLPGKCPNMHINFGPDCH